MPPEDQKIISTALSLEEARRHLEEIESRLCASEERFRTLVEVISDWIWETDVRGVYTYASPKVKDLLGYTPEEVMGKTSFDFMPPEEAKLIETEFTCILKDGRPFVRLENIKLCKDGRRVLLESSGVPIRNSNGRVQGWHGIDRDITEIKQIVAHQQKLEDIINQNDVLVLVWRMEANKWPVEFISGNVVNILGYTSDDFLSGRVLLSGITHQDNNPRFEEEIAGRLGQGERRWSQEYRLITKSGEVKWFHNNNLVFTDSTSRITKIQAVLYDITERKQIEEERNLISNRIRQAEEREQKKVAGAIHDIAGSMLVGLSSSLILVEEELKHGGVNNAIGKLHQTGRLVKDLVEMMKNVSADIWPPNLEITGLSGSLLALFSQADSYSKIKIFHSVNLPDDWEKNYKRAGIVVYRLVQEALSNAIKYSKAENLEVVVNYDDNKVTLSFSDDGCGFKMYMARSESAGCGLEIMKEQVKSIGGNIRITSELGSGTVIKADFPRCSRGGGDVH